MDNVQWQSTFQKRLQCGNIAGLDMVEELFVLESWINYLVPCTFSWGPHYSSCKRQPAHVITTSNLGELGCAWSI